MRHLFCLSLITIVFFATTNVAYSDCSAWNTKNLLETVTLDEIQNCLASGEHATEKNKDSFTPLHFTSEWNKDPKVSAMLIRNGADVNAKNLFGETPLHLAAANNSLGVSTVLIRNGADVKSKTRYGATPLHLAAAKNYDPEVSAVLIRNGANVKAKTRYGTTPLHIGASKNNNPEVSALLIRKGADIKSKDSSGATPLHLAATNNNPEVSAVLIRNGADVKAKTRYGESPLYRAASNNNPEVSALLIRNGAVVKSKDSSGATPLHLAATNNNPEVSALLIRNGADVKSKDSSGATPLHLAATNNNPEVSALLIRNGADVKSKDSSGATPLHLAATNNNPEVSALFIRNGADVKAKTRYGETPLSIAASKNNSKVTALLIRNGVREGMIERLDIRLRAFIPNPINSGGATGSIFPIDGIPEQSFIKVPSDEITILSTALANIVFARALAPEHINPERLRRIGEEIFGCHMGDSRGPTIANNVTSRMETLFSIIFDRATGKFKIFHHGRHATHMGISRRIDCQTHKIIKEKKAIILRDDLRITGVRGGIVEVRGHISGKDPIPPIVPSLDYKFRITWNPNSNKGKIKISHNWFPSYELHVRTPGGIWQGIYKAYPKAKAELGLIIPGGWKKQTFKVSPDYSNKNPMLRSPDYPNKIHLPVSSGHSHNILKITSSRSMKTLKLENGNSYFGMLKNLSPYSQGVMTSPDGTRYEGQWADGKKSGQGVMTSPDGTRYEGRWADGKKSGQGVMFTSDRKLIRGCKLKYGKQYAYLNVSKNSTLELWLNDSTAYCLWKNGKMVVNIPFEDKTRYIGEWDRGQHGKGVLIWQKEGWFTRLWKNLTIKILLPRRYEGTFNHGTFEKGIFTWEDGTTYEGETHPKSGLPHGKGKKVWANGWRYEGFFKKGQRHGQGILYTPNGEIDYSGEWIEDWTKEARRAEVKRQHDMTNKQIEQGRKDSAGTSQRWTRKSTIPRTGTEKLPSKPTLGGKSNIRRSKKPIPVYKMNKDGSIGEFRYIIPPGQFAPDEDTPVYNIPPNKGGKLEYIIPRKSK